MKKLYSLQTDVEKLNEKLLYNLHKVSMCNIPPDDHETEITVETTHPKQDQRNRNIS